MNRRLLLSTIALSALIPVLLSQTPVAGQRPQSVKTPPAKTWAPPHTPDGQPDLQGIWSLSTLTPLERPKGLGAKEFYTEQEFAELAKRARTGDVGPEADIGAAAEQPLRYDLSLYGFDLTKSTFASNRRTSLIVGPEGLVPPVLPQAQRRNAERAAKNRGHELDSYENRPLQERCIYMGQQRIPMLPAVNDNNPLQILQGPGYVTMLHEIDHSTRAIPTDGRPHLPESIRQWQGNSVGHWEGNTLVVDTTNFTNLTPFRGSGDKLHLVERFTRVADDTIVYRFTVDDPETWAKSWTAEVPITKTRGPLYESACHEGNSDLPTILHGARVAEQEAAGKAGK